MDNSEENRLMKQITQVPHFNIVASSTYVSFINQGFQTQLLTYIALFKDMSFSVSSATSGFPETTSP